MKGLVEDVKHALRLYRRTPGASLMVVAVLAIGMAFVTAFLSLYSDLILRPEPGFQRGGRIVSVGWSDGRNAGGIPLELYDRINETSHTLAVVAGTSPTPFRVGVQKEQTMGEIVTRQFFPGLRPKLALGVGFKESDHAEDGEPVVVISWRYWQEKFDGRSDVLGKTLAISAPPMVSPPAGSGFTPPPEPAPTDFRIIGVMDRNYTGTLPPQAQNQPIFWIPLERALPVMLPFVTPQVRPTVYRTLTARGIGRLASGASVAAATRELDEQFANEDFLKRPGTKFEVIDHIVQNIFVQRETQRQLQMFLAGSVLLALVAAANVSLFLLARAPGRRRELGIRMAVGAPLKRLRLQLASEAAVLVLVAAALGLVLSIWLARYLRGLSFLRAAQWRNVTLLDWRVLGLVGVFLLLVTLLVSLAPVAGLKRLGIAASSRLVSARASIAQRVAGTAQIAVASMLAGAAIAFAWHLVNVLTADPGYRTKDLYAVSYSLASAGRPFSIFMDRDGKITVSGVIDAARRRDAFAAIPGVTAVSLASAVPGVPMGMDLNTVADPKDPQHPVRVRSLVLDRHYVDLLGLRLVNGHNVTEDDPGGVLVNQTFARRFFGREDVAGELLPRELLPGGPASAARTPLMPTLIGATHIVGVLRDLSYQNPLDDIDPMILSPGGVTFIGASILQTTLPRATLQKQTQEALRTLDLTMMGEVQSLAKIHRDVLAPDRARGLLTIITAVIVVLLAAFGFYGTQRYLVTAGRREYAIRASLGAGPRALGRLVLRRGLMLGIPGLVLGTPLAFIVAAWLRGDYVSREVSPAIVTLAVVLGLVGLLLLASLGPARFARRTQPAPLLRED